MHFSIITDSYGGPRIHSDEGAVAYEQTYPAIVAKELEALGHKVSVDSASFRKLTDLPGIIQSKEPADVYILQAGIVDLYPRPLSQRWTLSQSFFAKLLRRIIRLNRAFFIRYLYNKPWSDIVQVEAAIQGCMRDTAAGYVWVNVPPVNDFQNKQTPGANESIDVLNQILEKQIDKTAFASIVDVAKVLKSKSDMETYLHPLDSHLNKKGNQLYASEIMFHLKIKKIL